MFRHSALLAIPALILVTSALADLPRPDLQVQSQADYLRLKQAISASQVVMTDLARSPNHRVVGVLASILQAAAENPNATLEQLDAFANAFDAHIRSMNPNDPDLMIPIDFLTEMRFGVRSAKQPGMRADFGLEILQMLGLHKDELATQLTKLMSFVNEQGFDLANSAELNVVLTYGFLGLDANGESKAIVRVAFLHYLSSQGFDPFPLPATMAEHYPDVAAAMAALPADYAALEALRAQGFQPTCQDAITHAGAVVDSMPGLVQTAVQVDAIQKSNYLASFVNPNIELLNAARAQRAEDVEALNGIRSRVHAELAVMIVAGDDSQASTAATISKYAADVTKVASGISRVALAFAQPSPMTISHGILGLSDIFGVSAGLFGADQTTQQLEDLLDQVVQMRQQMLAMHEQLNSRFDTIDRGLDQILYQLGDVQVSLAAIRSSVLELQSDLDRLNQNLFGALADGYQQSFVQAIDGSLAYKQNNNGWDLPYEGDVSFVTAETTIYTRATTEVLSSLLAGPTTGTSELTFINAADANMLNQANYGYSVNNLRLFPRDQGLTTNPLYSTRVANPTAWATAANAYAQLARENPWFYAYKDPNRLALITQEGQRVKSALQNFGNRPLLTALMQHHGDVTAQMATAIDDLQTTVLRETTQLTPKDGVLKESLDMYGSPSQVVPDWPTNISMTAYRQDGVNSLSSFDLTASHLAKFSQFQLFNNQHLLNLGTLHARVRPYWYDKLVIPNFGAYMLMAIPAAEVTLWHEDPSNGKVQIYGGVHAIGSDYIVLKGDYAYPNPAPYVWDSYLYYVYSFWTSNQNLRQRALDAILAGGMHEPDAARKAAVEQQMQALFKSLQQEYYTRVVSEIAGGTSAIYPLGRELAGTEALIEAYVSLGFPQSMDRNQLLRGLLKGDGIGLGKDGVSRVYQDAATAIPDAAPDLIGLMAERASALQTALDTAAAPDSTQSTESHPYIKYALAALADIQPGRLQLANDDHYIAAGGALAVASSAGVLANDAPEPTISPEHVGYEVVAVFDQSSQPGGQRTTAQGGTVIFSADGEGGFSYQPPAGFTGTDSFQYVARGNYEGETQNPVFSNIATAYIQVGPAVVITAQPQPFTAPVGGTAVFRIGLSGDCAIQWRKNGIPLQESGRVSGTQLDTLVISQVQIDDAGRYDVLMTPAGGAPFASSTAALTVIAPTVSGGKLLGDGSDVDIPDGIVSRIWPGFFYIGSPDRSSGIRVQGTFQTITEGSAVRIRGAMRTNDAGERYIEPTSVIPMGSGIVRPLLMAPRSIGGADLNYDTDSGRGQKGIKGGVGLNNIGLLVKVVGHVSYVDPEGEFIDIWDGPVTQPEGLPADPLGGAGIRVMLPTMPVPKAGTQVTATGISSMYLHESESLPVVLANSTSDISVMTGDGTPDRPDCLFEDTNGDGIDGDISRAVFVAPSPWGSDSNSGTLDRPVATIERGIELAAAASPRKDVYVAAGAYSPTGGTLAMQSGVSIYGLYDGTARWGRSLSNITSIIGGTVAISANAITQETHIEGFSIFSANATTAGGSSYGVLISNGTGNVVLSCNAIAAGSGAVGADGVAGPAGQAGGQGGPGGNGNCDGTPPGYGGAYGNSACGMFGGYGGQGGVAGEHNGQAGGYGAGGAYGGSGGAWGNPGKRGGDGQNGADGADGVNGAQASAIGTVADGMYLPPTSGNGSTGGNGGGGGGGGGGGAQSGFFVIDGSGNGGGGGGGGGAAGAGGSGGQGGGGSFAVFIANAVATVDSNQLTSGSGGIGGAGGAGGAGGNGGSRGYGAALDTDEIGAGGNGGVGGKGGNGGHGSGGPGGPSICIFAFNSPITVGANEFIFAPFAGGGGSLGNTGLPGISLEVYNQ